MSLCLGSCIYPTLFIGRFRTRERNGDIASLSSSHWRVVLLLKLSEGNLCLQLKMHPQPLLVICLSEVQLDDGKWHDVTASRY